MSYTMKSQAMLTNVYIPPKNVDDLHHWRLIWPRTVTN